VHLALVLLLSGLIYILGFGALSYVRRQGLSLRFAAEGLAITALSAILVYLSVPISPLLFLILIYLITMRVRLLVDLGNWFTGRKEYARALGVFRLALRLGPDVVGRRIVLINRGVTELRMEAPESAYSTLQEALAEEQARPGAKYLAAGYYNLGLACRRTGREAEAIRHFNQAIETLPTSIYAQAARRALEEQPERS